MNGLKYSEILAGNKRLGDSLKGSRYEISILSNIVIHQLNEVLEYCLRNESINAYVKSGNYDNIVQDSEKHRQSNLIIIFWELANIISGLQYKASLMNDDEIAGLLSKIKGEIDYVLLNLQGASLVLFNRFSSLVFNYERPKGNKFDYICRELNSYLEQKAPSNVILIDIDKIFADYSVQKCIDYRYYYSSKALYAIDFFKGYAQRIKPIVMSVNGKAKKAIIFDCDNTLWKGVLGEDGFAGLEMSSETENGAIFEEVQSLALELNKQGILLGLCSKNNPQDVDEVIASHPDMKIRDKHITIKTVNWDDKAANLKRIAKELNIGLDSLLFVDDSDFEANYIRETLPQVTVLHVPATLPEYPKMLRAKLGLFYNVSESQEDLRKIEMYKEQAEREKARAGISNLEEYLRSLGLELRVEIDNDRLIPRMAQMSQKTNQFNLTTKRYTEKDIEYFVRSEKYKVFALNVIDKYGDYGVAGLCIVQLEQAGQQASIDTFLMSCRVIGRNVEFSAFDFFVEHLKSLGIKRIDAKYVKTSKNQQVEGFYEILNFKLERGSDKEKYYSQQIDQYKPTDAGYIKVTHG